MSTPSTYRIFIVDDSAVIHRGLGRLLNSASDLTLVGQARSGEETLRKVPALKPDLAIVDIGMTGMNGVELTRRLKESMPELLVLILSIHDEVRYVEQALEAGASGYVLKDDAPNSLMPAVRRILAGSQFISESLSSATGSRLGRD